VNRLVRRAVGGWVLSTSLFALVRAAWPAAVFASESARRWERLASQLGMLVPLAAGALYALGVTRRLEGDNRARPGWMLLCGWLTCFAIGEGILLAYVHLLGHEPPIPSAGDGFFVAGYLMAMLGLVWFARVYASSGLPLGPAWEPALVAAAALVVFGVAGVEWLAPLARRAPANAETAMTLTYPVLDFAVLVPTAVLARLTSRFHGGPVWTIWASILGGFALLAAADTVFAYVDLGGAARLDPLTEAAFIAGYSLAAFGATRQYDLLRSVHAQAPR
jgi:hypothetical protein